MRPVKKPKLFPLIPRYDSLARIHLMNRIKTLLQSKTVWGALASAIGFVLAQPEINPTVVAQAAGGVLAAIGVRDALIPGR